MLFKVSPFTTAAFLASSILFDQASAHCKITWAVGNANPKVHGQAMLIDNAIPLNNGGQNPWQYDVTVFSDPIVPPVHGHPLYGKRHWMAEGCGATISTSNLWRSLYDKAGWGKVGEWDKNYHWYMNYLPKAKEAFIQTLWEATKAANTNKVPQVTRGGWVELRVHRVNNDGAGPFRCRIDSNGQGKYGPWLHITQQVSGVGGLEWGKDLKPHGLRVAVPNDLECNVKVGNKQNVCILRCENTAPNGPFGGCLPIELTGVKPTPTTTTTTQAPEPTADDDDEEEYDEDEDDDDEDEEKKTRRKKKTKTMKQHKTTTTTATTTTKGDYVKLPTPQAPKIITNPDYGYAGYDVNKGTTKDGYKKRSINQRMAKRTTRKRNVKRNNGPN